jgi:hypothetical protein
LDTCNFESGRLLLGGTYHYEAYASTAGGVASADITIEIQDTSAVVTINGRLRTSPPSVSTSSGYVGATIDLTKLFRIEIYNPNEPGESLGIIRAHGRFEFMNPSNRTSQSLSWYSNRHPCNGDWIIPEYPVLGVGADVADTLQVWQNYSWYGSVASTGGGRVEATHDLKLTMTGRASPGDTPAEATVYGRIIFFIEESE